MSKRLASTTLPSSKVSNVQPMEELDDPNPAVLSTHPALPSQLPNVSLNRPPEIISSRCSLPVIHEEQPIVEAIRYHDVSIIVGPTGSGKSTQLPQFLYEAGFGHSNLGLGRIIVVQPRRISAISLAQRVAFEMGFKLGMEVGYHVRFDRCCSEDTRILFVTDGILVQYLKSDVSLGQNPKSSGQNDTSLVTSAVIVDEAHERSVNTDVCLGMLSISLKLRNKMMTSSDQNAASPPDQKARVFPLRLVVMSATISTETFINPMLWDTPKILNIAPKIYPICTHFSRTTDHDYVKAVCLKISQIHRKLPCGVILAFVPGSDDCIRISKILNQKFGDGAEGITRRGSGDLDKLSQDGEILDVFGADFDDYFDDDNINDSQYFDENLDDLCLEDEHVEFNQPNDPQTQILVNDNNRLSDNMSAQEEIIRGQNTQLKIKAFPLYSSLPKAQQEALLNFHKSENSTVDDDCKPHCRLVIVATNVAETSLTIPNVRYVVDSGRVKRRIFHPITGASTYRTGLISQASAQQRGGRTGRTCPGHVFRLYSSAVFNDTMPKTETPEVLNCQIDGLILLLKSMGVEKVNQFPWVTCPDDVSLRSAENLLEILGAVVNSKLTSLGKLMLKFPVSPRFAKILIAAHKLNILSHVLTAVSLLSVDNLLLTTGQLVDNKDQENSSENLEWRHSFGDVHSFINLFRVYSTNDASHQLFLKQLVNKNSFHTAEKLRKQLISIAGMVFSCEVSSLYNEVYSDPFSSVTATKISKAFLTGFVDNVVRKEGRGNSFSSNCLHIPGISHSDTEVVLKVSSRSTLYSSKFPQNLVFLDLTTREIGSDDLNKMVFRMPLVCKVDLCWISELFLPQMVNPRDKSFTKSIKKLIEKSKSPKIFTLSAPQVAPSPFYCSRYDDVMCHVIPEFGLYNKWKLSPVTIPLKFFDQQQAVRIFANSLLKGEVFSKLKQFSCSLVMPPSIVLRPSLNTKVNSFLKVLKVLNISSQAELISFWKEKPALLLSQIPEEETGPSSSQLNADQVSLSFSVKVFTLSEATPFSSEVPALPKDPFFEDITPTKRSPPHEDSIPLEGENSPQDSIPLKGRSSSLVPYDEDVEDSGAPFSTSLQRESEGPPSPTPQRSSKVPPSPSSQSRKIVQISPATKEKTGVLAPPSLLKVT
ncbi:hypothetical protein P9112_014326 [Eukaryota sp. TZLM1-RC]